MIRVWKKSDGADWIVEEKHYYLLSGWWQDSQGGDHERSMFRIYDDRFIPYGKEISWESLPTWAKQMFLEFKEIEQKAEANVTVVDWQI